MFVSKNCFKEELMGRPNKETILLNLEFGVSVFPDVVHLLQALCSNSLSLSPSVFSKESSASLWAQAHLILRLQSLHNRRRCPLVKLLRYLQFFVSFFLFFLSAPIIVFNLFSKSLANV